MAQKRMMHCAEQMVEQKALSMVVGNSMVVRLAADLAVKKALLVVDLMVDCLERPRAILGTGWRGLMMVESSVERMAGSWGLNWAWQTVE